MKLIPKLGIHLGDVYMQATSLENFMGDLNVHL